MAHVLPVAYPPHETFRWAGVAVLGAEMGLLATAMTGMKLSWRVGIDKTSERS